jgi:hypothetical protein
MRHVCSRTPAYDLILISFRPGNMHQATVKILSEKNMTPKDLKERRRTVTSCFQ